MRSSENVNDDSNVVFCYILVRFVHSQKSIWVNPSLYSNVHKYVLELSRSVGPGSTRCTVSASETTWIERFSFTIAKNSYYSLSDQGMVSNLFINRLLNSCLWLSTKNAFCLLIKLAFLMLFSVCCFLGNSACLVRFILRLERTVIVSNKDFNIPA